ncbi:MAG: hypothetical protein AAFN77_03750 [Planctomycetota bacterium]
MAKKKKSAHSQTDKPLPQPRFVRRCADQFQEEMEAAADLLDRHRKKLLNHPGVVGAGVGFREKMQPKGSRGGRPIESVGRRRRQGRELRVYPEVVIKVYVAKKKPIKRLQKKEILPQTLGRGKNTFPVDVVELKGVAKSTATATNGLTRIRPDHNHESTGTLGCRILKDGQEALITNAHVAYGKRRNLRTVPKTITMQASISRHFKDFATAPKNHGKLGGKVDVIAMELVRPDIDEIEEGPVKVRGTHHVTAADLLKVVTKVGAKSKLPPTQGRIIDIFESKNIGGVLFSRQILVAPLSGSFQIEGDSGAALMLGDQLIGIMHARIGDLGLACKVEHIEEFYAEKGIVIDFTPDEDDGGSFSLTSSDRKKKPSRKRPTKRKKKRTTKKRATKKRTTKKRATKKKTSKKRTTKKKPTKKKKRTTKKRATKKKTVVKDKRSSKKKTTRKKKSSSSKKRTTKRKSTVTKKSNRRSKTSRSKSTKKRTSK